MVDMNEVNAEIRRLEEYDLTYKIAEKLAVLYAIRDAQPVEMVEPMMLSENIEEPTEFTKACVDVPMECLMKILDEHFTAVKIIFPKEYDLVIKRISKAKEA